MQAHHHRSVWGPRFWGFIHSASLAADATDLLKIRALLKETCLTVPCEVCAPHADEYFKAHPEYDAIDSADALFAFYVHFHNAVNARTDSCHGQWTVARARAFYSKPPRAPCNTVAVALAVKA